MRFAVLLLGVSLTLLAVPASAEWFGDLYAGSAFTQSEDVSVSGNPSGLPVNGKLQGVKFDVSPAVGGRAGYWFDNFGLALDVSHFQPNVSSQTLTAKGTFGVGIPVTATIDATGVDRRTSAPSLQVTAISFELMIRAALDEGMESPEFPHGRLQQYFFVGPTVFLTDLSGFNITDVTSGLNLLSFHSKSDTSLGATAGIGLTWLLTTHIGVFGEYRFTHVSPEFKSSGVKLETDLNTHHLLGGVSFRF